MWVKCEAYFNSRMQDALLNTDNVQLLLVQSQRSEHAVCAIGVDSRIYTISWHKTEEEAWDALAKIAKGD